MTTPFLRQLQNTPAMRRGDVHVWCIRLDNAVTQFEDLDAVLSDDERRRAESFRYAVDRDQFVSSRCVLRTVLATYVGLAPEQLAFCYPCVCGNQHCRAVHRKPALTADCGGAHVRFNLSHSAGLAAIVVCHGGDVGVDVERIDARTAGELVSAGVDPMAPNDARDAATSARGALQPQEFFRQWTRSEALSKALGLGLAHAGRAPALGWWVRDFEPAPGYCGAVAGRDPFPKTLAWFNELSTSRRDS